MLQGDAARLYSIKPTSDIDLSDPALGLAWARVLGGERAWALFSYAPSSKTRIALMAEGSGGLEQLAALLADDAVSYVGLRVRVGGSPKFMFLAHVGANVGAMLRGKAAMHRQDVEFFLESTVAGIHLDEDEGTAMAIVAKARAALGSQDVEFPPGDSS